MKKSTMMKTTTAVVMSLVLSTASLSVKAGEGCETVKDTYVSLYQCLQTKNKQTCDAAGHKLVAFTLQSRNKVFAASVMLDADNDIVCGKALHDLVEFQKSMNE